MFSFNREEQTDRKTVPFHSFEDDPNIYAGRDMVSGGTWLGFNKLTGIMVVLTNYWMQEHRMLKSRGMLVHSFLKTSFIAIEDLPKLDEIVYETLDKISVDAQTTYSAFNLAIINLRTGVAHYICSETPGAAPRRLEKGTVHGICNSHYEEVWPKTKRGVELFEEVVGKADELSQEQLMELMGRVMKDNVRFDEDDEEESSIFVEPYMSKINNGERKTKTSCFVLVSQREGKRELLVREVTYGK